MATAEEIPSFRIVVATRNRPDDLARLLSLMAPQLAAHANFHLVVVNDGSPGPEYSAVIERYGSLLEYRVLATRRGPGQARQAGLEDGQEDYFITTDDDCLPGPDWLARTEALARAHPGVDLFAGITRAVASDRPGIVERYLATNHRLPGAIEDRAKGLVVAVCAILMCRRAAFQAVGGFSPEMERTAQDWNLTCRMLRNGARYLVDRTWLVGHRADATLTETLRRYYHYGFGAAQHVLLEMDWPGARSWGNATLPTVLRQGWSGGVNAFTSARSAQRPPFERLGHFFIGVGVEFCQQWGWRKGLAHHGKRYRRILPRDLALAAANPLRRPSAAIAGVRLNGTKSIRIVVPTHRRPKDLEAFLEAMVPQIRTRPDVRLVVVNDGSHDAAYQQIVDRFAGEIDYRPQTTNRGPAATRMIGYADATEDYLVFTDDDCMAPPGWLAWLDALIAAYPEVDLFAGRALPVNSDRPGIVERYLTYTHKFPGPIATRRGLIIAMTANVACRREAYVAAGGYDPLMETAGEDWNLTHRLLNAGASYRISSDWVIGHKAAQSFGESWRRFFAYGWGGAQTLLLTRDWTAAFELHEGFDLRDSWRSILKWVDQTRRTPEIACRPLPLRLAYYAIAAMFALQYERGWRAGLRHYGKLYRQAMPRDHRHRTGLAPFVTSTERSANGSR